MFKTRHFTFPKIHYSVIILVLIVVFYLINGVQYSRSQSITSDEPSFYEYAIRYVKGYPERAIPVKDNSKMPVSVVNLIPRATEQFLHPNLKKNDGGLSDILSARFMTLLVSVFTILMVYLWAQQLYGTHAGLFAAFLMSICPNNIANAGLVTTDSYSALFLLTTMYFLWKFSNLGRMKYFLLFSLFIALSQLVKQSLFHLYVLVPILLVCYYLYLRPSIKFSVAVKYAGIFILVNLFIINAGYYFYHTGNSLGGYQFVSDLFKNVQTIFPAWLPVPFPKPFIDGLDMAKYYDQLGGGYDGISSFGNVTILGKTATGEGFWYYYFVSVFFKTPITYMVLFGWSLALLITKTTLSNFIQKEFFLLLPVLYFLIVLSFFYKTQCGIRHIIFIYPFIFIFCSGLVPAIKTIAGKILIVSLSIFLIISVLCYWKNYYPYTNELIWDKKYAYTYLGASNLDFRGGALFYKSYLENHPKVRMATEQPQKGIFLISVGNYLDVWNQHKYDWLRYIKPIGVVAGNGLLIKVTENDLPH